MLFLPVLHICKNTSNSTQRSKPMGTCPPSPKLRQNWYFFFFLKTISVTFPFRQQASFIAMKMKAMPQCHLKISGRFVKVTNRTGGQNYAWERSRRRHLLSCEETVWGRERQMKFISSPNLKINFICLQHFQPKPLLPNEIDEFQFIC